MSGRSRRKVPATWPAWTKWAAASVIAKVERDEQMRGLHSEYPEFGWDINKGYATAIHRDALRAAGATPYHRVSWNLLGGEL